MAALRWLPAFAVIIAASSWIGTAMATTYSVACDYTAITNAIAGAVPGDIIQIAAGTATLTAAEVINIGNSTMGISLIGTGTGQTILQKVRGIGKKKDGVYVCVSVCLCVCARDSIRTTPRVQAGTDHDMKLIVLSLNLKKQPSGNNDQSIIFIGATPGAAGSGLPTTITNITFRNTGVIDGPRTTTNSAYRAIHIRGVGGTDLNRGQIYNCEFFDFSDSAIVLTDVAIKPIYWDFHNNLFNGSRVGVYLNANSNCSVYDNTMRNFVVGVAMDANDAVSDVIISGNTFLGTFFGHGPDRWSVTL